MLRRQVVTDDDFVAGQSYVDREVMAVGVAMMVALEGDDDVARNHAVEHFIESVSARSDLSFKRSRMRHASEGELKGALHGVTSA